MKTQVKGGHIAGVALFTAVLTGGAAASIGGSPEHVAGAVVYVMAAALALLAPGALVVQVIGGLLLVGGLMHGRDWAGALALAPLVIAVVVTAELLALAGRMDAPFVRPPGADLRRAGAAAGIAGIVYAAVVLAGILPAPSGIIAVAAGSAACALLAWQLAAER